MSETNNLTKVSVEFTIAEVRILCKALFGHNPLKGDEMISYMLYARLSRKIDEVVSKDDFE